MDFLLDIAFAWLLIFLLLSQVLALFYPLSKNLLHKLPVDDKAGLTLWYGLLAPVIATLSVAVLMYAPLAGLVIDEHCHRGHCGAHVPEIVFAKFLNSSLLALILIVVAGLTSYLGLAMRRAYLGLRGLNQLSRPSQRDYRVVDSATAGAWCAGIFRPQVYVSQRLIEQLTADELQIILAHEHSHAQRFDNLRKLLLHYASLFWLTPWRTMIRADRACHN